MILVLALVTATMQPAAPKVGDRITVTFAAPVVLDASPAYEVVERQGNRVVVRTFEPKPFVISGTTAGTHFSNLRIPVTSVLKPKDDLAPAPLAPPRRPSYPAVPFMALGLSALAALVTWLLLWARSRKRASQPLASAGVVRPEDRYRSAVLALRGNPSRPARWAALANETRAYLAATRPHLGSDLTTSELLPRLGVREAVVREILRQGDLEKFSPRGAPARDFDEIAAGALELLQPPPMEAAA
ncbi:MAG: hypothetical protein ABI779_02440 [Acidobacteriota bacterium]